MDYSIDLVVDTSALVAILFQESEAEAMLHKLSLARRIGISAASKTELLMVIGSRMSLPGRDMALELLNRYRIITIPVDDNISELAAEAFFIYGKGRHSAGLNYGDCFSYALAKYLKVPLLFKGEDFSKTDISVLASIGMETQA
ncbi:Ribonuclease VapC30 [Gammaproteobacteria bacterium]